MQKRLGFLFFIILFSFSLQAQIYSNGEETKVFPLRISKLNTLANLIRFKVDFKNVKFLQKDNYIEFWNPSYPEKKCRSLIEGVANEYLLVRVLAYDKCVNKVGFTVGSYLHGQSPELMANMNQARELVDILQRKHLALSARLSREKKFLDSHIQKVEATNKRFETLKQKLEIEWQKELSNLERDKTKSFETYQKTQAQLNEVEYKMQQYKVHDQNMTVDRWSLDPKLYYRK